MITRIDSVFQLSNGERFSYLCYLMNTFRCSYVCLWSLDHTYSLSCKEGYYQEEDVNQFGASSSSGSVAQRLFDDYKKSTFNTIENNNFVPGLAFKQRIPYLELQVPNLHRFLALELQRQFYEEARVKVAIFLGCDSGEIELGMSYIPQVSMEMQMQTLFPQDFVSRRQQPPSMMELENIPFPTPESTDAAIARAYLAVLSSIPMATTTSNVHQMSDLHHGYGEMRPRSSAFSLYPRGLECISSSHERPRDLIRRQSTFKRTLTFYRRLNNKRLQEQALQGTRPTSNQLHHMISERRRREKINESFQALRSLLPTGTKKDKASVLRTTKEYVKSLKQEIMELTKRNKFLEEQLLPNKEVTKTNRVGELFAHQQRVNVSITPISESTSGDQRMVDMEVIMMRGINVNRSSTELLVRILEFLSQVREQASLVSMDAQNHAQQGATIWATFRLRIEGSEWDDCAFKEAIRRILAEFAL